MRKTLFSISLLLVASSTSSAEGVVRPGLWELTTTSLLLAFVPQIPPDTMQKLTSLAKQHGFDLPEIQNGAATSKVCITPEMAEQELPVYFHQTQLGCSAQNTTRSGNSYRTDLVCTHPQFKGNGTAEGTFTSPVRFSGQTQFNGVFQGNPVDEHADVTGRWINASCGPVKAIY
jgi:hypothetical protein